MDAGYQQEQYNEQKLDRRQSQQRYLEKKLEKMRRQKDMKRRYKNEEEEIKKSVRLPYLQRMTPVADGAKQSRHHRKRVREQTKNDQMPANVMAGLSYSNVSPSGQKRGHHQSRRRRTKRHSSKEDPKESKRHHKHDIESSKGNLLHNFDNFSSKYYSDSEGSGETLFYGETHSSSLDGSPSYSEGLSKVRRRKTRKVEQATSPTKKKSTKKSQKSVKSVKSKGAKSRKSTCKSEKKSQKSVKSKKSTRRKQERKVTDEIIQMNPMDSIDCNVSEYGQRSKMLQAKKKNRALKNTDMLLENASKELQMDSTPDPYLTHHDFSSNSKRTGADQMYKKRKISKNMQQSQLTHFSLHSSQVDNSLESGKKKKPSLKINVPLANSTSKYNQNAEGTINSSGKTNSNSKQST